MDRESVITHLQIIHTWAEFASERDLQFFTKKHLDDIAQWADDALELLKEQDALCFALEQANNTNKYLNDVLAKKGVEPRKIVGLIDCSSPWLHYSCGSCKEPLLIRYKFCPNCGKPIRW